MLLVAVSSGSLIAQQANLQKKAQLQEQARRLQQEWSKASSNCKKQMDQLQFRNASKECVTAAKLFIQLKELEHKIKTLQ